MMTPHSRAPRIHAAAADMASDDFDTSAEHPARLSDFQMSHVDLCCFGFWMR